MNGVWAEAQEPASFQGLGNLYPPGSLSRAWDLSADGTVITGSSISGPAEWNGEPPFRFEAFRWTPVEGMVGLGFLGGGEPRYSAAMGLSSDGLVIVGDSTSNAAHWSEAFRWTSSEGMKGLGFLPGGSQQQSWAAGVSPDGSVIVGSSFDENGIQAFLWTQAGGMLGLGDLAGGEFFSRAWDAALFGSAVVGVSRSEESAGEAFLWTPEAGMTGLGFLSREGLSLERYGSEARAVSADGATVVGHSNSPQGEEAFRWTRAGGLVGLGDLAGGEFKSAAWGVSADGSVVVGAGSTAAGEEAFIWDSVHGMRALKDVLEENLGGELTGWRLLAARRVSDDGRVVIGEGIHEGQGIEAWRAVLAPPPPPAGARFIRGDGNGDGLIDLADAIGLLLYFFHADPAPACLDGADANDDGRLDIGDPIHSLFFQFLGQTPPPSPFPGCGTDPSFDGLTCASHPACARQGADGGAGP